MPRRKQGHFSQSELDVEEMRNVSFRETSPLPENGIAADESQSGGKILLQQDSFREDPCPLSVVVPVLSSGRRRRTGVVSMSPQPMQQSVAENLRSPFCPRCKATVTVCSCNPPTLVPETETSVNDRLPTSCHKGDDFQMLPYASVVEEGGSPKMAGPLNGRLPDSDRVIPAIAVTSFESNEEVVILKMTSANDSRSLVGRGPIVSSLPWRAVKRENASLNSPPLRDILADGTSTSFADAFGSNKFCFSVPYSSVAMPSSVYGVRASNIETVLSGLILDKPALTVPLSVDCGRQEMATLKPDDDVPRTRCHSLPSSTFSLSNALASVAPSLSFPSPVATSENTIRNTPKLDVDVAVTQSSSMQTLSGYSISRTSKLTRPEVIEQHISKIISENAAIVETQDPLWIKRYMRQSSLASESNSDDESKKSKNNHKFRRYSEEVTVKYKRPASPKFKSKLHSALLGKVDEVPYRNEALGGRKMSLDSKVKPKIDHFPSLSARDKKMTTEVRYSTAGDTFGKSKECVSLDGDKHPENPEGSIIKDLLLKARGSPLTKSPVPGDEDSQSGSRSGLLNGDNGTRSDQSPIYYCLICNIGFRSKENLEAHKSHYCKGVIETASRSNHLEVPAPSKDWKTTGAVNKRSSSFSYPDFGSGQILKKQLLSGAVRNLSPSKKRKISEPVFSFAKTDGVFGYQGVVKHGRASVCSTAVTSFSPEVTGFPSRNTNFTMASLLPTVTMETVTTPSVVVTISKPVLSSGGTLVQYSDSQTRGIPTITGIFTTAPSLSVPGSVIVSPQSTTTNLGMTDAASNSSSSPTVIKANRNGGVESLLLSQQCSEPNRPVCLNRALTPSIESSSSDARTDNLTAADAKLVNKSHSSIAQKQSPENVIVPTVILSPSSPVPPADPSPTDAAPPLEDGKNPKKFLFAKTQQVASRPTTLPLSKKAVTLIGSTIVSPETPRPKRSRIQLYLNGQAYTSLSLKCSTKSFYCCIYRLQPMFVLQKTQPKLSMYSNWQCYPGKESPFGLTPGQEISLYNTRKGQHGLPLVYSISSVRDSLVVTHSSYWQFRKTDVEVPKTQDSLYPTENGKLTDPASDTKTGERVLSLETSSGQIGMESDPTDEGKSVVGQESLRGVVPEKKAYENESEENNQKNEEDGISTLTKVSVEQGSVVSKSPKRVRIFQGGFRSNEDYTYIRGRGRGKYVCEECGIRCKKPSMLKKHIRTHTDLRPYKCSHCAFAFKTKGNLTKHMKSKAHHKKCLELGIVPVPTTIDDSQIDESALSKQFSDADEDDDDDDLDEDEDESDYDEDEEDSQDHRDDEEMCSSEKDVDGVTRDSEQFEDAEPIVPVSSSTVIISSSSQDLPPVSSLTDTIPLVALIAENEIGWEQEREAARSLLNLSSCGLNRIDTSTSDWVMASPSPQIHKSEGSIGSMESLSSAAGCVLSESDIAEEVAANDNLSGIVPRVHWNTIPELSPKSRRRSYSVNMPPARSGNEMQIVGVGGEGVSANREHLQTRVISFASSLPVVLEDQSEMTTSRRYSMSAVGEARTMACANNPSTSTAYEISENEATGMILLSEEDAKRNEAMIGKNWVSLNGEQPMDLRITKEPREHAAHLPHSLIPHLWKSSLLPAPMDGSSSVLINDGKAYDVLVSPGSDLTMMSPERNSIGAEYAYSKGSSNRLPPGTYFQASDGEEMTSKLPYEMSDNLDVDGSVDMLEGAYSSEADDYQHPLSPVSQNSMDNDSQCNHIEDGCGGPVGSVGMMDNYGVKERQSCNPADRRSGAGNSQIEFRLSATVPSGSSISTSNHVRIESEGKCSCSICNKTFSKPSQLRLHVNIHYFERPFRCESCAVSFRTKGHLQKHKRSVSHYNKVNMNMTFGTPTTDNPRPFKCGDCKIAFRIHGHLAKHLRSKMHIMKLECLGKLPFGMYAEMERSGVNLNEIDTTDCENSLDSLQLMAHRLYQQDPRRMRWHTADGQAPPHPPVVNNIHHVVKESEVVQEAQSMKLPAPVQYSLSPSLPTVHPSDENLSAPPLRRSSIISSPIQANSHHPGSQYSRPPLGKMSPATLMSPGPNQPVKREPEENDTINCALMNESPSTSVAPQTILFADAASVVNCASVGGSGAHQRTASAVEGYSAPAQKVNVTVDSNVPFLHRSCTCHLCSRVFKSAKFLQVHLYCDHQQQQNQQQTTGTQWPSCHPSTAAPVNSTAQEQVQKVSKDPTPQWLDCDRTITNGIIADGFSCDICRKQFPTQITLQQHLLTHAQLRPFVCETCDAGFTSSVMLATHLATHQQDKPYMCHECGKSFAMAGDFQRHVQAHLNDAS